MKMTTNQLRKEVARFPLWYHKIDLGNGVVTPGFNFDELWDNIRKTRKHLDYKDKIVLDLGSWDGMWAFEAEQLGAKLVVATDCRYEAYENFLFCKEVLRSKVIPYYNVPLYSLVERLDVFFQENWGEQKQNERIFDIVQHLGLLYHLRDPLFTLSQTRSCMRSDGYLLIETAAVINDEESYMLFNGTPPQEQRIYKDVTTWWAPTLTCLKEILKASFFEPIEESICVLDVNQPHQKKQAIGRVCLVARAVTTSDRDPLFSREMLRTYRTPGLENIS